MIKSIRKTIKIEIRGENINLGTGMETLAAGESFFNRIENTLVEQGLAHNLTSIDNPVNNWYCWSASITYNTTGQV